MLSKLDPILLDESGVATHLRISRSLLRKWRRTNQGPPFLKLGKAVRYDSQAIDSWLRAQTRNAA